MNNSDVKILENEPFSPELIVLDGIDVFVDGGPTTGKRVKGNVFLASTDRVAVVAAGDRRNQWSFYPSNLTSWFVHDVLAGSSVHDDTGPFFDVNIGVATGQVVR